MIKYIGKFWIIINFFLMTLLSVQLNFILINNSYANEKDIYDSKNKEYFENKNYQKEYKILKSENEKYQNHSKEKYSEIKKIETKNSNNIQKEETVSKINNHNNKYNLSEFFSNKKAENQKKITFQDTSIFKLKFSKFSKIEEKIKIVNTYLDEGKINKLKDLSLSNSEIKKIDEMFEKKFSTLETVLGNSNLYEETKNFSYYKFDNKEKNIERLYKINSQLDYISKTLQAMGLKVN